MGRTNQELTAADHYFRVFVNQYCNK